MITPRRTRLVRVPDSQSFRQVLASLASEDTAPPQSRLAIVPTQSAARQLTRTLAAAGCVDLPVLVTRRQMYDVLASRLGTPVRLLTEYERDVMMRAAAREAAGGLRRSSSSSGHTIRPGVVAEMVRFYDELRRHGRHVTRFEELVEQTLAADADSDRGATRLLAQTEWLAAAFRGYEERVAAIDAYDEHRMRERVVSDAAPDPIREVLVTVGDWIAEPDGCYVADFDCLARLPGLEAIDVVATERTLGAGFHQRVHDWLPGLEEIDGRALGVDTPTSRPIIEVPGHASAPAFTVRDREEELIAIARDLAAQPGVDLARVAIVFKRPLPYLYLAREVFGAAGLSYEASDALPLAAEPFAAALDLVLDFVESGFAREPLTQLLRSPHFAFKDAAGSRASLTREAVSLLDVALSKSRYLGGFERLSDLCSAWTTGAGAHAVAGEAARVAAARLSPLLTPAAASAQLGLLSSFLADYVSVAEDNQAAARARTAVLDAIDALARAHSAHDDSPMAIGDLVRSIRRWIEELTSAPEPSGGGLQLIDDRAARFGDFDALAVVGLIENEWPERRPANIFYPSALLTALGWPPETDRQAAAEARFLDVLTSASTSVSLWTFTLDDEALVQPSLLLEEVHRARLITTERTRHPALRVFPEDALTLDGVDMSALDRAAREWADMRLSRTPAADAAFHGSIGQRPPVRNTGWSVSALETYVGCPFKFFAEHVLKLKQDPEDEEVMDPRTQGEFVHEVFRAFFDRWGSLGHQAITPSNLDTAREVFASVADEHLGRLSETEAALERTRLMGSPAAAGLAEAVLRMEAERPVPVVDRRLEFDVSGEFSFVGAEGTRTVALKGKADRIDLLADGTFRLIDYKLGWPPNKARALQLPVYSLCAEKRLFVETSRRWTLGEAAYLAFKGPRRVVPLFGSPAERDEELARAQQRLIAVVDAIDRGEFPPHPDDVFRCETCSYDGVCRKDYVGDV